MRKSILSMMLAVAMVMSLLTGVAFAAGSGTSLDPYLINNIADLEAFRDAVNGGNTYEGKYIKLTADITLTNENWTPIGTGTRDSKSYTGYAFKGIFDGNNKIISGLTINSTTNKNAALGLFGVVDGGTVKNLKLDNVNINVSTSNLVGGAIGMMVNGATADDITVSGAVIGNDGVGGIVGRLIISGTITGCINNASVTSSYGGIGGIVGKAYYEDGANTSLFASIYRCTNNGTITAPMYVGGIVGLARANVIGCINNGPVVGGTQTGGIIGQLMAAGNVSDNENKARISGKNHLGGIIGDYSQSSDYTYYNVTIANNINRGELAATEQCAAIMGCNNIDGFTAMTASGNVSYYNVGGLELFGNPEDMVIDSTNKFETVGTPSEPADPVAFIDTDGDGVMDNDEDGYTTLQEAVNAAGGTENTTIVLLDDVNENVELPANVTLDKNGYEITGVTGGTVIDSTVPPASDAPESPVIPTVTNPIPDGAVVSEDGTVTVTTEGGSYSYPASFQAGDTVAVTVTPADDSWKIGYVVINGVARDNSGLYVIENVTEALNIEVIFVRAHSFIEGIDTPVAPVEPEVPSYIGNTLRFTDVMPYNAAYDAINFVADRGIMNGTGAGQFSPDADLTRAMMATILWRMEGQPTAWYNGQFSDVKGGQWYSSAIAWANAAGIVEGYGNGVFGLNDSLTHGQLCAMLYRWNTRSYGDIDTAWNWAQANGLYADLAGVNADEAATRAEIAEVLMVFVLRVW
ncbi:MAG: hypothetical protein E7463_09685 [Ruminococcaceae bacterium]|nr:hypothetical protein [Oscillospiraceae bacterium]